MMVEIAVQMCDSHTVDDLEEAFSEMLEKKQVMFFV